MQILKKIYFFSLTRRIGFPNYIQLKKRSSIFFLNGSYTCCKNIIQFLCYVLNEFDVFSVTLTHIKFHKTTIVKVNLVRRPQFQYDLNYLQPYFNYL